MGRLGIEWIPAHLGETQFGVSIAGDGSRFSREQWEGSRLVDTHGKVAAAVGRRIGEV